MNFVTFLAAKWEEYDHALRSRLPNRYLVCDWFELTVVATLFMLMILLFMKPFGFCSRLRSIRREIHQHIYSLLLYYRKPLSVLRTETKLVGCNLKFIFWLMPILIFGGGLYLILHNTLMDRYGRSPLATNSPLVVRSQMLSPNNSHLKDGEIRSTDDRLTIEAVTWNQARKTMWTRLRAASPGFFPIQIGNDGQTVALNVASSNLPPLPVQFANGNQIFVAYPASHWLGWRHGWLVYFLTACLVTAIPIARLLRIQL